MDKKISCILPTYNGSEFLEESINSIINQTYKNWELIIVNDCSTDKTEEIIKKFLAKDQRIKYIKNLTNCKLPKSLNIGFEKATGDYYTWTSDDNYYHEEAFEKMLNYLLINPDKAMVYAQTYVEKDIPDDEKIWCTEEATVENLLKFCVCGACFLYRESVAKLVGEYDENFCLNEDHDYWLRIRLTGEIGHINEILYTYRLRNDSLTGTKQSEIQRGKILLLRKYRKIYALKFEKIPQIFNKELAFDKFIENMNEENFAELKKICSNQEIYKYLKQEYKFVKNNSAINYILKLKGFYIFKAIKLWLMSNKSKLNNDRRL